MRKPGIEKKTGVSCSFCGKSRDKVKKLISGPGVYICDECIGLCNDIITEEHKKETGDIESSCTLCEKSESQTKKLIAGPNGRYICSECIFLCYDLIMAEVHKYSSRS